MGDPKVLPITTTKTSARAKKSDPLTAWVSFCTLIMRLASRRVDIVSSKCWDSPQMHARRRVLQFPPRESCKGVSAGQPARTRGRDRFKRKQGFAAEWSERCRYVGMYLSLLAAVGRRFIAHIPVHSIGIQRRTSVELDFTHAYSISDPCGTLLYGNERLEVRMRGKRQKRRTIA